MTERISYVEIDLNRCSETYGVGACTASIPATGSIKCFNCYATCQDKDNYNKETVTSRHSTASGSLPLGIEAIPDLASVSIRPAQLDLGESIGVRASVTLTFKDARYPDTGPEGDRYLSDRDYDPYTQGSYWGKFRARYPYIQGADIRLIRGSSDQSLAQMETRHFIVDSVSGPDSSGTFTIVCKDILKLADSKKSQAPVLSLGELSAGITASDTSITLSPAGVGADYITGGSYPTRAYLNLGGEEIVSYTNPTGSDTITIADRGSFNTTAQEHEAGARVQLCVHYAPVDSWRATDVINDFLVNYSNMDASYIPLASWNLEDDTYIKQTFSTLIAEPTSVTSLINELLQQTASTMWWDDVNRVNQFRVLKSVSTDAALYNDDLIKAGTFSIKDQNSKRVSQVWTYFGQINPLESLTDGKNYSRTQANIDPESEANFEGTPSIRRIYSRWIQANSRPAAENLNLTILSRYSTPPRLLSYSLHSNELLTVPTLAGGFNVMNRNTQDATGATEIVPIQVTQLKSTEAGFTVIGEEVIYSQTITPTDPNFKPVEIGSKNNVNLYDEAILSQWSAPETGDTWQFIIESGAVIGSSDTTIASLVTGDSWPAGVTLNLINFGSIVGKGGAGGAGGSAIFGVTDGGGGGNGGLAIDASYLISIENNNIIGGGGGGGGGGGAASRPSVSSNKVYNAGGGGGGGGMGHDASLGGSKTFPSTDGSSSSVLSKAGTSGTNGAANAAGSNGVGGIVNSGFKGGDGASGATLGQSGADGADGVATGISGGVSSSGGAGGLAGSAINKNGNTVIITGTGIIYGDVNT